MFMSLAVGLALAKVSPTYTVQIVPAIFDQGEPFMLGSHISSTNVVGADRSADDPSYFPFIYTSKGGSMEIPLPGGAASGLAFGSNNKGQVVGSYHSTNRDFAFFWSQQTGTITLANLGGTSTATAINGGGEVVGWADLGLQGHRRATIFGVTQSTPLDPLSGFVNSFASDVNNSGTVFGISDGQANTGYEHATLWGRNGAPVDMGVLSGYHNSTVASANDGGDAVGYCFGGVSDDPKAFVFSSGSMTAIDTPDPAQARGINNKGEIVGTMTDPDLGNVGFAVINGQFVNLNDVVPSNIFITDGISVNEKGQILAGAISLSTFDSELVVLTP